MEKILPTLDNPTKNQILELTANIIDIKEFVFQQCESKKHTEFQDDLYQELFITLLEMEEERLIGIYERGELTFMIIKIVEGMLIRSKGNFHKTYIKYKNRKLPHLKFYDEGEECFDDQTDSVRNRAAELHSKDESDVFIDNAIELLPEKIQELHKYNQRILNLVMEEDFNQSEVHRKHKIHRRYISDTMKDNKKLLKKSITDSINLPDQIFPDNINN